MEAIDDQDCLTRAYADFEQEHERINGLATGAPGKFVNLRVVHRIAAALTDTASKSPDRDNADGKRIVSFAGQTPTDARIVDRSGIEPGMHVDGPSVIEQRDATTLVPAGWRAKAYQGGALILERTAD